MSLVPFILLGVVLLIAKNSTPPGVNPPGGGRQIPEWYDSNLYKDSNGIVWVISERNSPPRVYRGTASSGKYAGRAFTLPTWTSLKVTIDAFATTQKSPGTSTSTNTNTNTGNVSIPSIPSIPVPSNMGGNMFGLSGPPGIPDGAEIPKQPTPATAPIDAGERVVFDLVVPGSYGAPDIRLGTLEGAYNGPTDPSVTNTVVRVDRIASRGSTDVASPPLGNYTVPPSDSSSVHDRLARAEWTVIDPATDSLSTFSPTPPTPNGTPVTILVRDRFQNRAIAIAQVARNEVDGSLTLRLAKIFKATSNEGVGPMTLPTVGPNSLVRATPSQLVNPASIA